MHRKASWPVAAVCLALGVVGGLYVNQHQVQGQADQRPVPAVPRELTSYRDIVKKVLPAVVSVESRAKARPRRNVRPEDFPNVPEEKFRRFQDEDNPVLGFGSGVIVDASGVVLTNYHVVDGADSVEVKLQDGRKFTSKDVHGDRKTDLAIVRLKSEQPLPFLELGDSDGMEVGDRVLAVGAPFGLTGSVTHGIISAKSRNLRLNQYEDFLQTDAPINPGNSGGPLISLDGKVIGINSAIKSRSGGFQGVGLAISSNLANSIMKQLLKGGVVKRGYLGVQIKDLTPEVAARLNVKGGGVVVSRVFDDSPASKGGLKAGDVVMIIDGKVVHDGVELQKIVAGLPLGKPVGVEIVRDGKPTKVNITIEEQPDEFGAMAVPVPPAPRANVAAVSVDKVGLSVTDATPDLMRRLGFRDTVKGALVLRVEGGSLADRSGLVRGTVIERVEGKPVDSANAFRDALATAPVEKGALLQVRSPVGGSDFVVLRLAE